MALGPLAVLGLSLPDLWFPPYQLQGQLYSLQSHALAVAVFAAGGPSQVQGTDFGFRRQDAGMEPVCSAALPTLLPSSHCWGGTETPEPPQLLSTAHHTWAAAEDVR